MQIFILHPGKAAYPEIDAYKDFFKDTASIVDGTLSDYNRISDKSDFIVWCIMGFYPKSIRAKFLIHDYRSLSVGKYAKIKDTIKRVFMQKPNLRIFQNEMIEKAMGFKDDAPHIYLPMGVPSWIYEIEQDSSLPKGTFCYIGEITKDRGMHKVLKSFLKSRRKNDTFVLVGNAEDDIYNEYKGSPGVNFTGKVSQKQAVTIVKNSDYTICRIPKKYPYDYQMPTKFIEYAALGKTIICNDSPSNMLAISTLNYSSLISEDTIFSDNLFGKLDAWKNQSNAFSGLDWNSVIEKSGIFSYIAKELEEQ